MISSGWRASYKWVSRRCLHQKLQFFIQFDKVSMEKMAGRVISGFTLFHGREIKYYTYFSRKKSGRENKVTLFHAHGQKWFFPYKFKNPPPCKKIF